VKHNCQESVLAKFRQDLSESSDCIQQLNSNALNYAKENESLVASLQAAQIVADTVPALKISLQNYKNATQKSEQQFIQSQFNVEASTKSLEVKDRELSGLKKKINVANQNYMNLLASQTDKVKEAKDSALHEFNKELKQCLTTIQTGSIQLDEEFRHAYQNLTEEDWCLTDLFALIQELLTFMNDQNSSSVADLEKHLTDKESIHRNEAGKFKQLNDTLKKDISTKLFEINDLKSKILLYQKTKLSLVTQLIELIDVKTQLSLAKKDIFTLQHKSGNDSN
jgi:signal transduction histidine kinase